MTSVISYSSSISVLTTSHVAVTNLHCRNAMAKAVARLRGRDYVIPGDVREVFIHTVAHRLLLSSRAEAQGITAEQILREILESVNAPKLR